VLDAILVHARLVLDAKLVVGAILVLDAIRDVVVVGAKLVVVV